MNTTLIKNEPEEVAFEEEYYQGTKCGQIFFNDDRKYTFICEFCKESFDDMIQFGVHWEAKHFSSDVSARNDEFEKLQIKMEISDCPPNEEADTTREPYQTIKVEVDDCSYGETSMSQEETLAASESFIDQVSPLNTSETLPSGSHDPQFDEKNLYCVPCDQNYTSQGSFQKHVWHHKRNTGGEDFKMVCEFCNTGFKLPRVFRLHVVSVHGNNIPKALQDDPTYLACERCNQTFETPLERHEHEQMHKPDDRYHCPKCSKTFVSQNTRRSHLRTHDDIRPFPCPHCSLTFRYRNNLEGHVRLHLGLKPYACQTCGKRFTTSSDRNEHSSIHTNVKPYECIECGARFRLKSNLRQHLHHHSDVRYKCEHCGIECVSVRKLKNHLVKHSDERPYVCTECQATFKYLSALKKHLRMHARQKSQVEIGKKSE